jgi:hypothetical protein
MTLVEKILALQRFKKTLVNLSFTVSLSSTGQARVKYKKKIVIAECPDNDFAELLSGDLNRVVKTTQERIENILMHLAVRCEQLTLFTKDADDAQTTGLGGEEAGRALYPDNENQTGKELSQGLFNNSRLGDFNVQHGAVGTNNGISLP